MSGESKSVRMEIKGLMLDPSSNTPIVILRDADNEVFLPIWIGIFEANAIALRIEGVEPPRPMTHDLLFASLKELGAQIEKVTITDLRDNTFYALISLQFDSTVVAIDSRPSDAIALALRAEAPIFVLRSVLESAKAVDLAGKMPDEDRLKKWLEDVDPDDLGKYKM
jgi:bifunctional DNase/RNase